MIEIKRQPCGDSPFWVRLGAHGNSTAVADLGANRSWTYLELQAAAARAGECLAVHPRGVVLLFAGRDVGSIANYLGTLQSGHVLFLSSMTLSPNDRLRLIEQYRPEIILSAMPWRPAALSQSYRVDESISGHQALVRERREDPVPHRDLALLLATSASTGSAKVARFGRENLAASAAQVVTSLHIDPHERLLACLPFSFVYGLSVLNSALQSGATIALCPGTPADREYWSRVAEANITSLPTVSQLLEYLRVLRIDAESLLSVRKLTHSGEALDPALFTWAYAGYASRGVQMYLMYGQTEACGRMTVLQPEHLPGLHRSVGKPVASSHISVGGGGEVVFEGPAVMMGYAHRREDLALGDQLKGTLRTGDVGRLDANGFLFLTGRLNRYCKVFGQRINLDDVEQSLSAGGRVAVIENQGSLIVFVEGRSPADEVTRLRLAKSLQIPPQCARVIGLERIPYNAHGKVAYAALRELVAPNTGGPSPAAS
jgi:acyl-coenzyme A synthetase/AMP-(fatty) acid ligase